MAYPRKRKISDLDPDYEDVDEHQKKRQKLIEATGKEATISKIESILQLQFCEAIKEKEVQIHVINQRLSDAQRMLDRLRACIVSSYYSMEEPGMIDWQGPVVPTPIHPTVKKPLAKRPKENPFLNLNGGTATQSNSSMKGEEEITLIGTMPNRSYVEASGKPDKVIAPIRMKDGKYKHRITIGNISRYIPIAKREENDPSTHKWMIYVRGPRDSASLGKMVKEVWFFLHPSYRPNDLVVVTESPFHLTRRGWGEFPVRVQLHFHDSRNKQVDVIHHLKLDRTYTGLQTLGSETVVDIEVANDVKESGGGGGGAPTAVGQVSHPNTTIPNGGLTLVKTEPGPAPPLSPAGMLSPGSIKKEPTDSPADLPASTGVAVAVKQEPPDSPSAAKKQKGESTTSQKGSAEAGWIQFKICGENLTPSVSSPSPAPPTGSPKPGWTKISDLSSSDAAKAAKSPAGGASLLGTVPKTVSAGLIGSLAKPTKESAVGDGTSNSPAHQQVQMKVVGPGLKAGNAVPGCVATAAGLSPAQLVYVKCIDKSGMALLTPKQVQSGSGAALPLNANDILLKVTPPRGGKAAETPIKSSAATATASKNSVTLAALPKNTTLVYCSSKISPQPAAVSTQSAAKKAPTAAASLATGGVALARPGQYYIQYPTSLVSNSSGSTSILRPRLPGAAPVLQSLSVPGIRPGAVGAVQNVFLTKPGTGRPALQSILTTPPQAANAKDPKKPTIAIMVSSPGTYVLGKSLPIDNKATLDGQTTTTSVLSSAIGNYLVKQPTQGKTISLLRPGLLQTKVAGGASPRLPASSSPALNTGQITLIASPTTNSSSVLHQTVQISQPGNAGRQGEHMVVSSGGIGKPQSSVLYIVPSPGGASKPPGSADTGGVYRARAAPSHSILGPIKKTPTAQQSPADLVPKFASFGIAKFKMADMKSMTELVNYAVKMYPLVSAKPDRNAHPYCAAGYADFLKWNIAKQRAAEWTRACAIRKAVVYLMALHKCGDTFRGQGVWSRRQIVVWCRRHCYTPLPSSANFSRRAARFGFSAKRLASVTDHKQLITKLEDMNSDALETPANDVGDEEIDIVCERADSQTTKLARLKEEPEDTQDATPESSNPNVVGDILMRCTQNFVEDLIRGAAANMYDERYSSIGIGAIDLYDYIKTGNVFDFLSNNHMGFNVE